MWSICKKEVAQFFAGLSGYITIILFLLLTGMYLFLISDSSILTNGYASLDGFFYIAPWVFIFLIPAISMRSLAEEYRSGTIEVLLTRPISISSLVIGKFLAIVFIAVIALLPTLIYVFTINELSTAGGIDGGAILGSYIGLLLLAAVYAGISLFAGSLTSNATFAFLLSAFLCFVLYYGFSAISKLPALSGGADYYLEIMGIDYHYYSMSRGVLDSRDLIYFASVIFFALFIAVRNVRNRN